MTGDVFLDDHGFVWDDVNYRVIDVMLVASVPTSAIPVPMNRFSWTPSTLT